MFICIYEHSCGVTDQVRDILFRRAEAVGAMNVSMRADGTAVGFVSEEGEIHSLSKEGEFTTLLPWPLAEEGVIAIAVGYGVATRPVFRTPAEAREFRARMVAALWPPVHCPECGGAGRQTGVGGDSGYEGSCHYGPYL